MTLQVSPAGVDLPWLEKPETATAFRQLEIASEWVNENLPYKESSYIYRPEMAWLSGGNCYAQALGCLALFDRWDIPAGLVLDDHHAHVVANTPQGPYFVDPMFPEIRNHNREASKHGGYGLDGYYRNLLPSLLKEGDFVAYFYREHPDTGNEDWHVLQPTAINGQTGIVPREDAHLIVDSAQGRDVLLAVGDLVRYGQTKPHKYVEEYHNLVQFIPDFIDLTPPWHHNSAEPV